MNRMQFMEQLEKLLSDISQEERREALDFYNGYFDDAGEENEAEVIRELGSPAKAAAIIKAGLKENSADYGEYTERGYEDPRSREPSQMPETYHGAAKTGSRSGQERNASWSYQKGRTFGRARAGASTDAGTEKKVQEKKKNSAAVTLVLILLVLFSPLLCAEAEGILGVVLAVILLPFIFTFALGAAAVALFLGGIACLAAAIPICAIYPAAGILTIGIGLLLFAFCILFLTALVAAAGKMLPWLWGKCTETCRNLFNNKERKDGERV